MRRLLTAGALWSVIWIVGAWLLNQIPMLHIGGVVAFVAGLLAAVWYWQGRDQGPETE